MSSCLSDPKPAGTETRAVVSSAPGEGSTADGAPLDADGAPLDADGGTQDIATTQPIQPTATKWLLRIAC